MQQQGKSSQIEQTERAIRVEEGVTGYDHRPERYAGPGGAQVQHPAAPAMDVMTNARRKNIEAYFNVRFFKKAYGKAGTAHAPA
jgi:hypothetical protein